MQKEAMLKEAMLIAARLRAAYGYSPKLNIKAAQMIEHLLIERAVALHDLRAMDVLSDCEHCKHRSTRPRQCDIMDCDCSKCDADCACRDCMRYGKWEWRGVQKEVSPDD